MRYRFANDLTPALHFFKRSRVSERKLRKLRCALIFYFETSQKLRCGLKFLKFVAL